MNWFPTLSENVFAAFLQGFQEDRKVYSQWFSTCSLERQIEILGVRVCLKILIKMLGGTCNTYFQSEKYQCNPLILATSIVVRGIKT